MLVVMLGMAALAIDVGYLYKLCGETQNTADAGALAGATVLQADDWASAYDTALDFVQRYSRPTTGRRPMTRRSTLSPRTSRATVISRWTIR
jgi:hypothetical protein